MTLLTDAQQMVADAQQYANDAYDDATALVDDAQRFAQGSILLNPQSLAFVPPDEVDTSLADLEDPGKFQDGFTPPVAGLTDPTFESLYIPELPDFGTAPDPLDTSELFKQSTPVFDIDSFNETAPDVDTNIDLPDSPELLFPDQPASAASALDAPDVATPTFDEEMTLDRPDELTGVAEGYKADFAEMSPQMREAIDSFAESYMTRINPEYSAQMEALEAKIAAGVEGGKGLSDEYEVRVFDRAKSRIEAEREGADRQLADMHAKRGFVIPPGALMGGMARANEAVIKGVSQAAADTAIDRATRELQHAQFSMQLSSSLRQAMVNSALNYMGNLIQINGQAMTYAKDVARIVIDVYNANLAVFEAEARVYQTKAQVYEVRLEAAFAELRSFQAKLDAIRAATEIDQLEVSKYSQLIEAEEAKIRLYLAQLQGVAQESELKKLQVELFSERVRAYVARVQGKEAEFGAYRAAISGDEAKVRAYSEQVQAYRATVDAGRSQVDAEAAHSRAITEHNRNLIDQFNAGVTRYRAELEAEGKRFDSSTAAYRAALDRYRTKLDGKLSTLREQYNRDRLVLDAEVARYKGDVDVLLAQGRLFQGRLQLMSESANAGARVLGDLASSAVAAQNSIVSLSATE